MSEIIKVCDKHGDLTIDKLIKRNDKNCRAGFYYKCRQCMRQHYHEQYIKHREKKIAYARQYQENNRDTCNAKKREYREKNSVRSKRTKKEWNLIKKDWVTQYNKIASETMTDGYIRSLLARNSKHLRNKDVNIPELIEIKRASLILKRNLKSQGANTK